GVAAVAPACGGAVPGPWGPVAPGGKAGSRPPLHDRQELSAADPRGSLVVSPGLREDVSSPSGAGPAVWDEPEHSSSGDSCPPGGAAGDAARAGGGPGPGPCSVGAAPRGGPAPTAPPRPAP